MAPKPKTNALPALAPAIPNLILSSSPKPCHFTPNPVISTEAEKSRLATTTPCHLAKDPVISTEAEKPLFFAAKPSHLTPNPFISTEAEKSHRSTAILVISTEAERSLYSVAICNIYNLIPKN